MSSYPAVLYVEDDPKSRMVMEVLLKQHLGLHNVSIFENSADFEARLDALPFQPDLVFLDIHVDPLDGFQMLALLRQRPAYQQLPIVALTASVMNEEIQQLRDAGFNGVIPKPIEISAFPDTIKLLLSGESVWRVINR